jgi:hypothetical protein
MSNEKNAGKTCVVRCSHIFQGQWHRQAMAAVESDKSVKRRYEIKLLTALINPGMFLGSEIASGEATVLNEPTQTCDVHK